MSIVFFIYLMLENIKYCILDSSTRVDQTNGSPEKSSTVVNQSTGIPENSS